MNIEDYVHPDDAYTPRPKASQAVAAAKRAQRSTDEPEPLATTIPPRRQLLAGGMVLLILAFVGAASYQLAQLPSAKPLQITTAATGPAQAFEKQPQEATSAPTPAPTALPRTIGAYASPDGVLLGQIELSRMRIPVAHCGADWSQSDVEGSGLVWIRRVDVPDLPITGPDLCAPAQPAPQTGRGLGGSGNVTEATATPAPQALPAEPTATLVSEWPTSASAQIADFEKPDITDRCKLIGCLGQQAVDLARAQACHALFWQYGNVDAETIAEPDLSAVRACVWEGLYR